jgi:hypothetical protein
MKLKEFVSLLHKSIEKDPDPIILMYVGGNKLEELRELDIEWERAKEAGEFFNVIVDTDLPGTVLVYPDRYPELLAMQPTGNKIYPKDESFRVKMRFITKIQTEMTRQEEDEKYR